MERLCRLCGKIINADNFEIIGEIEKEMLDVLVKLSFSPSEESVMCGCCAEELERCFQFKANCLYTEDYIFPFIKQQSKIDMLQIYRNNNQKNLITIAYDEDVCRLCMEIFESRSLYTLEEVDKGMLQKCIPEVNVSATQQTLFCNTCLTSLTSNFNFTRRCIEAEEKIKTSFKNGDRRKFQVMLTRIEQFTKGIKTGAPGVKLVDLENQINDGWMKMEDECNLEDGPQQDDTSSATEHYESQDSNCHQKQVGNTDKKKHENKQRFSCEICSRSYSTKYVLAQHKLFYHEEGAQIEVYECDQCSYKSRYKSNVSNHKMLHKSFSESKIYKCKECLFITRHKHSLKGHLLTHLQKPKSLKLYKCEQCSYKANAHNKLMRHMLNHKSDSEVQLYSCGLCTYNTRHKNDLNAHELTHKSKSEVVTYDCYHCSYKAKLKVNLIAHMTTHKSLNDPMQVIHKCNICGVVIKTARSLKRHTLVHKDKSEIQMYHCYNCNFESKHKSSLRSHIMIHMDSSRIKTYKCEVCPFQAKFKSKLRRHSLTHLKVKQPKLDIYNCKHCSYTTKEKHPFKRHLLQIHNDKSFGELRTFQCLLCSYQTVRKDCFVSHVQTHRKKSSKKIAQTETCGRKYKK